MSDLLDIRTPEAESASYRKAAGHRSRPIDSAGLSHDYGHGPLARYAFDAPPEEMVQAFVSYSVSKPFKQRSVDRAWYSAVLDKTCALFDAPPDKQRSIWERGKWTNENAPGPDHHRAKGFLYAHLDAATERSSSEDLLTRSVGRQWAPKGRPRSAAAGATEGSDLFRHLMAVARTFWAEAQLDRIHDYAVSEEVDVGDAIETARTVVRQFREAGTPVDDVSLGVERDIFVKAGRITAMIDADGDVAIALPLEGGERRYLDVAPGDVAQLLAVEDAD